MSQLPRSPSPPLADQLLRCRVKGSAALLSREGLKSGQRLTPTFTGNASTDLLQIAETLAYWRTPTLAAGVPWLGDGSAARAGAGGAGRLPAGGGSGGSTPKRLTD
jgi:hypothetical protein